MVLRAEVGEDGFEGFRLDHLTFALGLGRVDTLESGPETSETLQET